MIVLASIVAITVAWSRRTGPPPETALNLAPAQDNEFLIIIAAFVREGGEPQPIGGALVHDLQQQPAANTRIEMLPRAPLPESIPNLIAAYHPRLLVTGSYDTTSIHADVVFIPPHTPPPAADPTSNDVIALFPPSKPAHYHLYAPLGNESPLRYLQEWIQAQSNFWQGSYQEALPALRSAKSLLPPAVPLTDRSEMDRFSAAIDWQLGIIAGPVQSNWQAAFDLFSDAVRLNPRDPTPVLGLAAAQAQLRNLDQAETTLRRTLRNHDSDWRIYFALAQIEIQKDDVAIGLTHYQRALALLQAQSPVPSQALASVYFSRGYQLLDRGEFAKAQEDFQQALLLGGDDIYVQANLGWAAYMAGDFETAVRASAAARQQAPDRPDLAFNEALHLLAAGQTAAARTAYRETIDLTLRIDDVLTRSTYFGVAYRDLSDLQQRMPDRADVIQQIQTEIDQANG